MDELTAWAGMPAAGRPENLVLTEEELCSLADGKLVDVGAHTAHHPVLSSLTPSAQQEEILQGKHQLEGILGRPVVSFSYPYGGRQHYTAETVKLVRQSGFSCACSNFPAVVQRGTDRYQLPRFLVRDWDGDEFARRLQKWFRG